MLTLGQIVFLPGRSADLDRRRDGRFAGAAVRRARTRARRRPAPRPQFVSLQVSSSTTDADHGEPRRPRRTTTQPATTTPTTSTPTTTTPTTTSGHKTQKQHPSQSQTIAALIPLLRAEIAQLQAELRRTIRAARTARARATRLGATRAPAARARAIGLGQLGLGQARAPAGAAAAPRSRSCRRPRRQLVVTVDLECVEPERGQGRRARDGRAAGQQYGQWPDHRGQPGRPELQQPATETGTAVAAAEAGSGNGNGNSSSSTVPVTIAISGHHLGRRARSGRGERELRPAARRTTCYRSRSRRWWRRRAPPTRSRRPVRPHKLIPVTTGLFAAGYVEISGPGIYQGLQVTDSQG